MIKINPKPYYCYYSGEIEINDRVYTFTLSYGTQDEISLISWVDEIPENFEIYEERILVEFKKSKRNLLKQ